MESAHTQAKVKRPYVKWSEEECDLVGASVTELAPAATSRVELVKAAQLVLPESRRKSIHPGNAVYAIASLGNRIKVPIPVMSNIDKGRLAGRSSSRRRVKYSGSEIVIFPKAGLPNSEVEDLYDTSPVIEGVTELEISPELMVALSAVDSTIETMVEQYRAKLKADFAKLLEISNDRRDKRSIQQS